MKKIYTFFDGGTIRFDDQNSVKELLEEAFQSFGYYEPFGMEYVTVFQAHHPETTTGWFTTDINLKCADEIKNPHELCFAYHMPGMFYYAEGGWGHHMKSLGNHPHIPNAVSLNLRFEDFDETVVINGDLCFREILSTLQNTGYTSVSVRYIQVLLSGIAGANYLISSSDEILELPLRDFLEEIRIRSKRIEEERGGHIYHEIFKLIE